MALFWAWGTEFLGAQSRPFAHGALPAGWKTMDNTKDNNGFLQYGIYRILRGDDMGFGFIYDGAKIVVEQVQKPTSFEEFRVKHEKEADSHARNEDSQTSSRAKRRESGMVTFNGFKAFRLYLYRERHNKHTGKFYEEDIVSVYLIQVGKAYFEIFTEAVSDNPGGAQAYQNEVERILATFQFFGQGTNTGTTSGGGNTGGTTSGGGNTGGTTSGGGSTTSGGGDDEDISIGAVVVGVGLAVGTIVAVGLGIGKLVGGGGATVAGGGAASGGTKPNSPGSSKPATQQAGAGRRRRDDEPTKPEEGEAEEGDKEDKEDQNWRYVLQISTNQMSLALGQSQDLQIAVWRVNAKGEKRLAEQAEIALSCPSAALEISPKQTYKGSLNPVIRYAQASAASQELTVTVNAQAAGQRFRSPIKVKLEASQAKYEIITASEPPNKLRLKADGRDTWYFYAQVINREQDKDPKVEKANQMLSFEKLGEAKNWLFDFEPRMIDGWKAIGLCAQHPEAASMHRSIIPKVPAQLSLLLRTQIDGQELTRVVDFPLEQPAMLDVDRDSIDFVALSEPGQSFSTEIKVFIENPGEEDWTFEAAYEGGKLITQLEILPQYRGLAILRLKTPTVAIPEGQNELYAKLLIRAKSPLRPASNERQVNVCLRREGILLLKGANKAGILQISGEPEDPAQEARFGLFIWDKTYKALVSDALAAAKLQFDWQKPNEADKKRLNMLSVAKLQVEDFKAGPNSSHDYGFKVETQIAGQEELFPFRLRVEAYSEITKQTYELILDAAIFGQGIGPNSEDWQKEYNNCMLYIDRHVPEAYKPQMRDMVETRKMSLGHEGLHHLRHKIHAINQNLILAEGAEGYRKADKWYTDMIELLEWCEWAGNLAFNVVASSVFGPYAPAVTISKSYAISALQHVMEGKTLDSWVEQTFTLHTLFKAAEGRLLDVDKIADYFKGSNPISAQAKAWAIFIAYHFAYNVFWEKKSVVEALKQVAREIRDEAIIMFFQRRLKAEGEKQGMEPITDPLRQLRQSYVARANGQHEVSPSAVAACMRDPQTMRSLKKASPELQRAFNRTREAMYNDHDTAVRNRVANELGCKPEDLRVDDFRTPGADPTTSINTDRDYRLLRRAGVDANGNEVWFEVPKEKWQDISYKEFGRVTNKPPGVSDLEWAQRHLQLATDKYHIEASMDYSDHAIDPRTGEKRLIRPNILAVEEGTSRLFDAEGLGNMYHEKVHASLRMNQYSEAVAQCKKGVHTLDKVRAGYEMQGLDVGKLPDSMKKGMEIIQKAPVDRGATPEAMAKLDAELKALNFRGVEDFSNKLSAQFHSLRKYDQSPFS